MPLFALATLLPVPLIAAGALWGGLWAVAALASMTLLIAGVDLLAARAAPHQPDDDGFPAGTALAVTLGIAHFALLGLLVARLGDAGAASALATYVAAGLYFGQVSNSNAHELIHRTTRALRRLGVAIYVSLLFGHHASAHPLVHHRFVATARDPNSARLGEGFWRYAHRAWTGSFRAGLAAERERLARAGRPRRENPYLVYLGGAAATLVAAALLGGPRGALVLLSLAAFAQLQLLLSDYVQHYGLRRPLRPDGRPEPVAPGHSWNSPHPASSALMLNAPRHSDHHAAPSRAYPGLRLPPSAPMLPRSLPVMACLALWPRAWRRVMDPRVRALAGE
ncbi:alkane 1-monooxygenase [Wenxinia marina]|uniref:Putative ABC-type transport system involved in lysophospholipase L1 biosynthesis n=1 Tax=Wenxinia marina DSM 24838 TaxID=1123501 RepID=A0A0D0NIJ9_9RHOB|nr:alkane 1-monooxygenase [Wenxinia marina]KIQ68145.1 putative ABC-type transport system involved in lysophospholipase L1 biosynthesis [Wenxinia marina DSM 24838]GGL78631.1 hypothetical protein GCM10011392_36390 [Wenxinia marina]